MTHRFWKRLKCEKLTNAVATTWQKLTFPSTEKKSSGIPVENGYHTEMLYICISFLFLT